MAVTTKKPSGRQAVRREARQSWRDLLRNTRNFTIDLGHTKRQPNPTEEKLVELFVVLLGILVLLLVSQLPEDLVDRRWETYWIGGGVVAFFLVAYAPGMVDRATILRSRLSKASGSSLNHPSSDVGMS